MFNLNQQLGFNRWPIYPKTHYHALCSHCSFTLWLPFTRCIFNDPVHQLIQTRHSCPLKFHPTPLECSFYVWIPFTRYVFKRLKFLGNRQVSWALTMLFMGLWHGVWPGYYINFSLEMLDIMAERTVSKDPFLQSGHVTRLLSTIVWWEHQKVVIKIKAIDLVFGQIYHQKVCTDSAMMEVLQQRFVIPFD